MGFMEDTHVSRSRLQGREKGQKTQDTSGLTLQESLERSSQDGASLKTSGVIYDSDLSKSGMTFEKWVTQLGRDCLARRKSAQATNGNGCSSWPIAAKRDYKGAPSKSYTDRGGGKKGEALPAMVRHGFSLQAQETEQPGQQSSESGPSLPRLWMTPKSGQCGSTAKTKGRPIEMATHLTTQTHTWKTPHGLQNEKGGGGEFHKQATNWPTPDTLNHLDGSYRRTPMKGRNPDTHHKLALHHAVHKYQWGKKLNPLFVEWLMGLPVGWTDLEPVETRSYLLWQQRHSSLLQEIVKL